MNVRQLIEALEKIENKDREVYVKSGGYDGCCSYSGEDEWDVAHSVEEATIYERKFIESTWRNVNTLALKIDTY